MGEVIKLNEWIETDPLKKDLSELNKGVEALVKSFNDILKVSEAVNKAIKENATSQSKAAKSVKEVTDNTNNLSNLEKERIKIQEETKKVLAKVLVSEESRNKTLQKGKALLQEKNAQIKEEIKLSKTEEGSIDRLVAANKRLISERNKFSTITKDGRAKIAALNKEIDNNTKTINLNSDAAGKQKQNIGNYGTAINGVKGILGAFGLALGAGAIAVKAFNGVMQSTQTLADGFEKTMIQAKAGVDFFFRSIATGDWKDFGARFKEVMAAAGQYAEAIDELGDRNRSFSAEQSEANIKIAELDVAYRDVNKTTAERKSILTELLALEKGLSDKRIELLEIANDAEITNASVAIGLSKEKILQLANEYDSQKEILELGKQYNAAIKEQKAAEIEQQRLLQTGSLFIGDLIDANVIRQNKANAAIKAFGEEGKKAGEIQSKYQSTNDAMLQKVTDTQVKLNEARAQYDEETRRSQVKLQQFNKEISEQEKKDAEEAKARKLQALQDNLAAIETDAEKQIQANKALLLKKEIDELTFAARLIEIQIDTTQRQLAISEISDEKKLELTGKLLDAQLALQKTHGQMLIEANAETDAYILAEQTKISDEYKELNNELNSGVTENLEEEEEKRLEIIRKASEEQLKVRQGVADALMTMSQQVFSIGDELRNNEMISIDNAEAAKLEMYKGNEVMQDRIRSQFDRKRKEVQRKEAQQAKLNAIFNIIIGTAQAIIKTGATIGYPAAIPFQIALGILGGVQAGIVANRPIPKFAKGVKDFEGGAAIVGDAGREIGILPTGKAFLSPGESTLMNLPKGTDILPNHITEQVMNEGGLSVEKFNELIIEHRLTRKAIINRPVNETNLTERGLEYSTKRANIKVNWSKKYMNR